MARGLGQDSALGGVLFALSLKHSLMRGHANVEVRTGKGSS